MTNIEYENTRMLDVINERDEIIDSKSRNDIHKLGLLHREVHVWMFDENNNIFFQKRGLHQPSAGLLDVTVGGHLNKGEGYLTAACRETKEETGVSILPSDLILLKKFKGSTGSPESDFMSTINNFIRTVYIYKYPINYKSLRKEAGIPGGGFQKLSIDFLLNLPKEYIKMFHKYILTDEFPLVLKHLK